MRPPSPLRSSPGSWLLRDQVALGKTTFGRWLLGKALWGRSSFPGELEHGLDVSVTAAVGAGRSVVGGGAALERRSLERRRHAAGSLHQRDSSPTPHTHYAKMSSGSAGGPQPTLTLNIGGREKPRSEEHTSELQSQSNLV